MEQKGGEDYLEWGQRSCWRWWWRWWWPFQTAERDREREVAFFLLIFVFLLFSSFCSLLCFLSYSFLLPLFFFLLLFSFSPVFLYFFVLSVFLLSPFSHSGEGIFIRGKEGKSHPTLSNRVERVEWLGSCPQGLSPLFFHLVVGHGCGLC